MPNQWYYEHNGDRTGPWTETQLKELARSGLIAPTDTIWKEGIGRGVPAKLIKNLFNDEIHSPAQAAKPAPETAQATAAELDTVQTVPTNTSQPESAEADPSSTSVPSEPPPSGPEVAILAGNADPPAQEPAEKAAYQPTMRKAADKVEKKGRATAVKGMVIISQDGETVRYKKKCVKCGHVDVCANRLAIKSGTIRGTYFCPKCRKVGEVIVQCNM